MNNQFVISLLCYVFSFSSFDLFCLTHALEQKQSKSVADASEIEDAFEMLEEIYHQIEDLQDEIVSLFNDKLKLIIQVMEVIEDSIREKK